MAYFLATDSQIFEINLYYTLRRINGALKFTGNEKNYPVSSTRKHCMNTGSPVFFCAFAPLRANYIVRKQQNRENKIASLHCFTLSQV
jgi:hypothetical protein